MDIVGVRGHKVDVIPTTRGESCTEIYNKKGEYLGALAFDKRKRWQRFVLVDLDKDMQMSRDCIIEAFELTEGYWGTHNEQGE
jgi:hypothetical protein